MILPLSALAFAALDDSTLETNRSKIKSIFLAVDQRALPSITDWPSQKELSCRYMTEVCYAFHNLARLDVNEQFLASEVHRTFKKLRKMHYHRTEQLENVEIKRCIRQMQIFRTLGGRRLLAKMADPSYYANLRFEDIHDTGYEFLCTDSHHNRMRVLAELGATSFNYERWNERLTVRDEDIDRHIETLRVGIVLSKRPRVLN
jgi:hypothetical protein